MVRVHDCAIRVDSDLSPSQLTAWRVMRLFKIGAIAFGNLALHAVIGSPTTQERAPRREPNARS